MANEVFKGLFGFSPQELTQQRNNEMYSRNFQQAQLDPNQQLRLIGLQSGSMVGEGLKSLGQQLFNIEDPQMKEATMLDQAARQATAAGLDLSSSEGLLGLASSLSQQGASPRVLAMLGQQIQAAKLNEAKLSTQQAQGAKYTNEAQRVQDEATRENAMRAELAALPPDATDEQRYAVVMKYGNPDKVLSGIDYRARLASEKEARTEQLKLQHEQRMEQLRQQGADRAQIAAETRAHQIELQRLRNEDRAEARGDKAAEKRATEAEKRQQMVPAFDSALATLDRIDKHPGKKKGVGFGGAQISLIPGTDAAGFRVQLDTFKAQTFLPMVASLKGMGALSDAEGKKLTDAVGALSPDMSEKEFNAQIAIIRKELEDKKARAMGSSSSNDPLGLRGK